MAKGNGIAAKPEQFSEEAAMEAVHQLLLQAKQTEEYDPKSFVALWNSHFQSKYGRISVRRMGSGNIFSLDRSTIVNIPEPTPLSELAASFDGSNS